MSEAAAVSATPSNFDAHLSSVDMSRDPGDFQDSTGPSNTNAMRPERDAPEQPDRSTDIVQPDRSAQANEEGTQDYRGEDGEQDDTQPEFRAEGEEDQEAEPQGDMPSYEDLQQMYLATQSEELHDFFLDKTVLLPNGKREPVREVIKGRMRMADYSRGKQELAQGRRELDKERNETRQILGRMTDPKNLRATLRYLGPQYEQAFHAAAKEYADEYVAFLKMTPAEQAAHQRALAAERRAEELEMRARQRPQEPQRPEQHPYYEPLHAHLNQVVPQAYARHGVHKSPEADRIFQSHIQAMWDGQLETVDEVIEAAAVATAEELGDRNARHQQHVQAQLPRQPQALPPRRLPAPAPARQPGAAPQGPAQRARVSDFDSHLKGLR